MKTPTAKREVTSSRIASIAARGMREPLSLAPWEIAAVCASALTQFEKKKPKRLKRPKKT